MKKATLYFMLSILSAFCAARSETGIGPDYGNLYYWAASPHKKDMSDSIPGFLKDKTRTDLADVFFIHPTTYVGAEDNDEGMFDMTAGRKEFLSSIKNLAWNADLMDSHVNAGTDTRVLLNQVTVFNGSCRVFAPRYRQASIKAFFAPKSEPAQKAFDLAYSDIKMAFEYYLKNEHKGRPVIIASHSQGTLHAIRLLQDYFDGKPLQSQLVCAYLVGHQIPIDAFKNIRLSTTADAIGGFVGWRSYREGVIPYLVKQEEGNSQCINPLTWTDATGEVFKKPDNGIVVNCKMFNPGSTGAAIEASAKILWVSLPSMNDSRMEQVKNLHILDYNLFWIEIRTNVKHRVDAYFKSGK